MQSYKCVGVNSMSCLKRYTLILCAISLTSCTESTDVGLNGQDAKTSSGVYNVRQSSNITHDGYCIVRVFIDDERSTPYLGRLHGAVIEPVDGVGFENEPNYSGVYDYLVSLDSGFLIFRGKPNFRRDALFYDPVSREVTPIEEVEAYVDIFGIAERGTGSETRRRTHFSGRHAAIFLHYVQSKGVIQINIYDRQGSRSVEMRAFPYGAWLIQENGLDALLVAIERPNSETTYELLRLYDSEGARLDVPKMEVVTLSPKFWEMKNPAGREN